MAEHDRCDRGGTIRSVPDHLFRLVVEELGSFAIFVMDVQGCVITWNKGAQRLLGYTADEVLGTSASRFFTEEDIRKGRPERELREAAATGRAEDRSWMVRKDGSRFWASGVTRALRSENGQLEAFAKAITDITEVRRAEEERAEALAREWAALAQAKAAEDLRKAEERFHLLVSSVKDYAIFMLDPHGHIISWNEGAERIKGYQEPEIIGKNFEIFYTPEDRARGIPQRNLAIAAAEGRLESEGWRLRKDGSRFWADVVITALHDASGRLVGFAKVTRDLTERKRAEDDRARLIQEQAARAAVQESEQRITDILNSITDAFFAVDHQFRFTFLNDRARDTIQTLQRRPHPNLRGETLWEVVPQLVGTRFETEYRRVISEHVPSHFEEFFPPWGVWFEVHAYPSDGGMTVYFRDITKRKRLEEERDALLHELDDERNWLRAVIEYSPVGILLVEGSEGQRVTANRRAEDLFGHPLPPEGGIAQYVGQIYLPNGAPRPRSELATVRALQGKTVVSEEELLYHPTGKEVRALVSAVPIRQNGKIAGAVVVYEDITRIRELERLREEWTSVVTHDLRQPITLILGYVGVMARDLRTRLTPHELQRLEHVMVSARNLNKMIGDLLEVSRIESRRLKLQPQLVNLADLVRDVVNRMAPTTDERPIRLEVEGAIPAICVDPTRIEQVLSNLLPNAAKYSYPQTEILVSVERRDDEVEVSVTDHGAGIPPSEIPRLFSRFYRTEAARAGKVSGLGLGLYISKELVEAHGGRIWVESVPEKTTTFHFTLPVVAPGTIQV